MNKQLHKRPRLQKRTVAVLNQTTAGNRNGTILILVTTSGVTSTIIYTLDPPLQG
jgi:hypothetical protein